MRRLTALVGAVALMLAAPLPALATTEPVYFYPDVDGYPSASLKTTSPTYSGPMLDIDGNGKQGRRVDKSNKGLSETDDEHFHQWSAPAAGLEVTGAATLTIWFADKSFDGGDTNRLVAYLLDCGSSGCTTLATTSKDVTVPDGEDVFKETTLTFPSFDHTFASGRSLRLRVMIDRDFSDDDMTFAYDTTNYATRLKLSKVVPPPTTTTTTSTSTTTTSTTSTTTTMPTTTTTKATTTTTKASTTTTTAASSTSTSKAPTTTLGGESTTSSSSTTTTTVVETTSTTQLVAAPGPSTTVPGPPPPPQLQDLDKEKVNLVIRTTPAQRGVLVSSPSVELSPVEGLMVTFVTAAETVKGNLLSAVGLGLIMASLLVIGMSRRRTEEPPSKARS